MDLTPLGAAGGGVAAVAGRRHPRRARRGQSVSARPGEELSDVAARLQAVRSAWQTNAVGRTLLTQSVLMSAVMWQTTVNIWWNPDYPGRDHVRFVIYTMGALSYLVMLRTLSRAQRTPPGPDVPESGL